MTNKNSKRDFDIEGSIFWILMTVIALTTFVFYSVFAYQTENLRLAIISFMFAIMLIAGIVLSKLESFNGSSWKEATFSFTLGFLLWGVIGGGIFGTQSIMSVVENNLFATISGELPFVVKFTFNTFLVPIAEEIFWFMGLTYAIISILNIIGRTTPIFKNAFVQMAIILPLLAVTFAYFHVGKAALTSFIIAAMFFRIFVSAIVIGDQRYDWFKKINIGIAFALGSHIANNWFDFGFIKSFTVMATEPIILWSVIIVFGAIFGTAAYTSIEYVGSKLDGGK